MEYPQLKLGDDSKLWLEAASREIGRLPQGKQPDMPTGSNTMHFMDHRDLPTGCKATYLRIVAAIKLHKIETHRIRFTVGGNRINYKGKVSTPRPRDNQDSPQQHRVHPECKNAHCRH